MDKPLERKNSMKNKSKGSSSQGRVLVFARTRPFLSREDGDLAAVEMDVENDQVIVSTTPDVMSCLNESKEVQMERKERAFKLDGVFPETAAQKDVFHSVGLPVLMEVMKGFNGCIFAYGQTGSGKTYSLLNSEVSDMEEVGILPRLIATLYARAAMEKKFVYTITAAGCQVYNEQVDDLLHPEHKKGQGHNLTVNKGGDIPGLTWVECKTPAALLDTFKKARSCLFYAETKMNKSSSRSHAVFQIRIMRRARNTDSQTTGQGPRKMQATCGQLSVVDLAGSERVKRSGVTGSNFKEATNINGSLLALGNVIQALADKRKHVPFRDSKLTRILEGSVGGNCKTSLLVCVSPAETSTSETLSTLEFASRAMCVEVDAKVNETVVEIDASKLAADLEEDGGATYVDEEMMKTFKESEQALAAAEAKAAEQERQASSLKAKVSEMESVLSEKDKNLSQILHENKRQVSQIDLLNKTLTETEQKHTRELELAKKAAQVLQSRVSIAEKEVKETKITLQQLTEKHIQEQRARKEAQERIVELQKEMETKQELAKQALEASEKVTEELRLEMVEKISKAKQEYVELQERFEAEKTISTKLEASIQALEQERETLSSNLKQKAGEVMSMTELLSLEQQKVTKLSAIQKEADQLRQQLATFKLQETELHSKLTSIEQEKGKLNNQVYSLEASFERLKSSLEQEEEMRKTLESDKEKLLTDLKHTEQTLDEKQQQLRARETKFSEDLASLKNGYENLLTEAEQKAREDAEKRSRHHSEAIEALEIRARQEHEKMTEKLKQVEREMARRQTQHVEELEELKQQHAQQVVAKLEAQKAIHEKEADNLRARIKEEMDKAVRAEKAAALREEKLKQEFKLREKRAGAAAEAARVAMVKELEQANRKHEALQYRFTMRESRKEDTELIAKQQREVQSMKRTLREYKKELKMKQTELEHLQNNMRIFGPGPDGNNQANRTLPGQKFGDRQSFLKRKQQFSTSSGKLPVEINSSSRSPLSQSAGSSKEKISMRGMRSHNPVQTYTTRPGTSHGRLTSTRRTESPDPMSPLRDTQEAIPPNPNRGRPLPTPPM